MMNFSVDATDAGFLASNTDLASLFASLHATAFRAFHAESDTNGIAVYRSGEVHSGQIKSTSQ